MNYNLVMLNKETEEFTKATLDHVYNKEMLTMEGLHPHLVPVVVEKIIEATKEIEHQDTMNVYAISGKDFNEMYHLTGNNRYKDDIHIIAFDSSLRKDLPNAKEKIIFVDDITGKEAHLRYFSDVVDNNARREIRKGNEFYKEYHSLYGDEWFWSTI